MQRGDDKPCSGSDGDITGPLPKGCLDTLDGQPPKPPPVDERTRIVGLYATTILTPPICDFPSHNFFTLNRILATHDLCFSKTKMGGGFKHQTIAYLPVKDESFLEIGSEKFGCTHYERRCKIVAPCCNEIFDCRHCHNDAKNSLEVGALDRHDIPRHELERVICSMCETEQDVQQMCITCGTCLGKYFCSVCKFFDDDVSKNHYHCEKCGICRTGGKENFFHCDKCGCCYSNILKDSHVCVERAMHHNCPICFEYLFDTPRDTTVLPCGHTIHLDCVKDMERHSQYSCPVCLKSYCDMTRVWEKLDQEIAATPMPQIYRNKMVWILCNDCGETSEVNFHVLANKCTNCKSYNTRQTRGGHSTCSSGVPEMVQ